MGKKTTATFNDFASAFFGDVVKSVKEKAYDSSVGSIWMYRLRLKFLNQVKYHIITEEELHELIKRVHQ